MTAPSRQVQGFSSASMPADWPAINADDLAWLLQRFPQLHGGEIAWHSPRPLSAAAIIEAAGNTFFIKRHAQRVRNARTLGEEHHFIAHLRRRALPVPEVVRDVDGRTALEHGDWTYEVHAVSDALDLYRDVPSWVPMTSAAHALAAGRMLARLHLSSADYVAPQRHTHILVARDELIRSDDPVATLQAQLVHRPALADYLNGKPWQDDLRLAMLPWHAAIVARYQAESRLWSHNDWHASNLLWTHAGGDAEVAGVIDFGLCSPTSALFDLATAIERNAIAWLRLGQDAQIAYPDIALALLDGYRSVCPLHAAQLQVLAGLLPIVHFDFALSEVEYFHGITGSTTNADLAYHGFLLDHTRWFGSADGHRLLAALRDSD